MERMGLSGCIITVSVQATMLLHEQEIGSAFVQYIEVQDTCWRMIKKLLCHCKKGEDALNDSNTDRWHDCNALVEKTR